MSYRSPVADILFSLKHVAGLDAAVAQGLFGDLDSETVASVISEAGRFATDVIAPLNWPGDVEGARYENGVVTMPKGFREAYKSWAEAGWAGVTAKPEYGGMGLPHVVNFACGEIWNGASMGFALCPLLSEGALGALNAYASEELRETYMRKLISGEWTGTMNLTEPQAGSTSSRTSSISCSRACPTRLRERAAFPCFWSPKSWSSPTARSAPATMCAARASSIRWASTPRPPA